MSAFHLPEIYTLQNGLRIVYQYNPGLVSHCGLVIGTGTRDEHPGKEGLAHFIEHVLFKGTRKRKSYQVLNRLEVVGGELNAYTTREETCVHASFIKPHLERAVEIISDIVLNSIFPDKELEKEKEVVLDEIHSYMDNPMEQIYDDFESQLFKGHPLGNPILGTEESVKNFSRKDVTGFVRKNYTADRMVFSYTGSSSFKEVVAKCQKYFQQVPVKLNTGARSRFRRKTIRHLAFDKATIQAHYITGGTAYSYYNRKRYPLFLLNNILGGPGMNSRLNMNIREKHGYTYNIESAYIPYSDTGLFNVYLATEKKFLDKTIRLVYKELKKLRENRISEFQLSRYRRQLTGHLAISQENKAGVMLNHAKSILSYGKPVNMEDLYRKIHEITASEILEVANEVLRLDTLSSLLYRPESQH